jgi:hypothetical protein
MGTILGLKLYRLRLPYILPVYFLKGEREFETDRLVEGGTLDGLFNGKAYKSVHFEFCY